MLIPADPDAIYPEDLLTELSVHRGMTKSVRRARRNGRLVFNNKFNDKALEIESDDDPAPFIVKGFATPQKKFTVKAHDAKFVVTINPDYDLGSQFAYSAKIEGSTPEDPIVVIDRR